MADVVTTFNQLKILAGFVDEDDRTLTINDPRANLTEEDVKAIEPLAAPVLIGDKFGATFSRFKSASVVTGTKTKLDLKR